MAEARKVLENTQKTGKASENLWKTGKKDMSETGKSEKLGENWSPKMENQFL